MCQIIAMAIDFFFKIAIYRNQSYIEMCARYLCIILNENIC